MKTTVLFLLFITVMRCPAETKHPPSRERDIAHDIKATKELDAKCSSLEASYRERLRADQSTLRVLEAFIEARKQAMNAEIELIGGSWKGSGEKTARAAARLNATTAYLEALRELKTSLHFQDMPE